MTVLHVAIRRASYGSVPVLRDVELTIDDGQIVALLGANGAGKTTLLRSISGLLVRVDGRIELGGDDITKTPAHRRPALGIAHVPEGRRVFPELTVLENLRMGAHPTRADRATITAGLDRSFEIFPRLAERRDQQGSSLSGGEQQMLAIARGLMSRPRVLLVDEASLGLSPVAVEQVFGALATIARQRETAVLLVEQNARASLAIADRAYVLERGSVAIEGAASDLADDPRIAAVYLGGEVAEPATTRRRVPLRASSPT